MHFWVSLASEQINIEIGSELFVSLLSMYIFYEYFQVVSCYYLDSVYADWSKEIAENGFE